MSNFRFTNKAVEDLANIWNYTFDNWSESQADIYYLLLIENCKEIASNPELGKNYTGISKNLKGLRAGRHIIFFRKIEKNSVEIIRILHEQMDLKHRMREQ
jgi:toxin ParE1/3/4